MSKKVRVSFSLKDDFGNKYMFKSAEELDEDMECLDVFYLIKAFKKFLINAGFTKTVADRVTYEGILDTDKAMIEL